MQNKNTILAIIVILVLLAAGFFIFTRKRSAQQSPTTQTQNQYTSPTQPAPTPSGTDKSMYDFRDPKKAAHYVSNTPEHAAILAGVPINVVIDFDFDLASNSSISVKSNGVEYSTGDTIIDANNLAMRINMDPASPNGLYDVTYNACWPDGSCHDGSFQFAINKALAKDYDDQTGQTEVTIRMSDFAFDPRMIKISAGTVVTWVNNDDAEHFINTDSHPAHTYYPDQNSFALAAGESYTTTFDMPGIYPYHCSAHAANMTASILVE